MSRPLRADAVVPVWTAALREELHPAVLRLGWAAQDRRTVRRVIAECSDKAQLRTALIELLASDASCQPTSRSAVWRLTNPDPDQY